MLIKKNININFFLVIFFIFSIFIISTDNTLKFFSINLSSMVEIFMAVNFIFVLSLRQRNLLRIYDNPLRLLPWLLFIWVTISFIIAKIDPSKAIPSQAYSYLWTTGPNYPDYRGWCFLVRFFLSIFAIYFITSVIDTKDKFLLAIKVFIMFYFLLCLVGLGQIVLFSLFNIKLGHIVIKCENFEFFRIGGYVGEPQTFGLLLISGYFILLAAINNGYKMLEIPRNFLIVTLIFATIDLIFTFSITALGSVAIGFIFNFRRYVSKKIIFYLALAILLLCLFFYDVFYKEILFKAFKELSTINERTVTWIIGLFVIKNNLLTGVGIGQVPFFMGKYVSNHILINYKHTLFFNLLRQPPMNSYLELWAESGTIGFLILILIIYKVCKIKFAKCLFSDFVKYGCGTSLLVLAIAANLTSGNFYSGMFIFVFSMYLAGNRVINKYESCYVKTL